jgi:hypothetical protein
VIKRKSGSKLKKVITPKNQDDLSLHSFVPPEDYEPFYTNNFDADETTKYRTTHNSSGRPGHSRQ